jgi:hypothetical protein
MCTSMYTAQRMTPTTHRSTSFASLGLKSQGVFRIQGDRRRIETAESLKNLFFQIFSHGTNASRNHDEIIATIAAAAIPDWFTTMAITLDLLMTDRTHYRSRVLTYSCTHRATSARPFSRHSNIENGKSLRSVDYLQASRLQPTS